MTDNPNRNPTINNILRENQTVQVQCRILETPEPAEIIRQIN